MKIQKVKIASVIPNEANPRVIKDDKFHKLVKSIQEFPEMLEIRPIVVDEDMVVLGGNMRLRACKDAGLKEVFILKVEGLTSDQKAEFIVKDNVGFGEWDWDKLANEWNVDKLEDWGLNTPYFASEEIDLNDFFDASDPDDKASKFSIVLDYSEEDYAEVIELFGKHSGSRESIVLELLKK